MINYTATPTKIIRCLLALGTLISLPVWAQVAASVYEPPRVYVVNFTTTGSDPHFANLALFTPELIRLQLLEMPMLDVVRTEVPPACGEANRSEGKPPNQIAPSVVTRPPGDYFLI